MSRFLPRGLFHRLYDLSIVIKGVDGVLETMGGVLLLFLSRAKLDWIVIFLTQRELTEDPNDKISNFLVNYVHELPNGVKLFGAFYLIAHGVLKVFLVYNLLKERRWIFPYAIGILSAFVAYQCYRLSIHFSYGIAAITLFDLFVIWFIIKEYRVIKEAPDGTPPSTQRYWFREKSYGFGWSPTWEGWSCVAVYVAMMIGTFRYVDLTSHSASATLLATLPYWVIWTAVLVVVVALTSEPGLFRGKEKDVSSLP